VEFEQATTNQSAAAADGGGCHGDHVETASEETRDQQRDWTTLQLLDQMDCQ